MSEISKFSALPTDSIVIVQIVSCLEPPSSWMEQAYLKCLRSFFETLKCNCQNSNQWDAPPDTTKRQIVIWSSAGNNFQVLRFVNTRFLDLDSINSCKTSKPIVDLIRFKKEWKPIGRINNIIQMKKCYIPLQMIPEITRSSQQQRFVDQRGCFDFSISLSCTYISNSNKRVSPLSIFQ